MDSRKNASAIAAANITEYHILLGVWQQENNVEIAKYYVAAAAGAIALFTIVHWTRFFFTRYAANGVKESTFMRTQVSIARLTRHYLNRPFPGFTSVGHALFIVLYLIINIILIVTHTYWIPGNLIPIGNRMGWMAMLNLALVTFLSLKNTPLNFLTAHSYESLNYLHQAGGYTTVICAAIHGTMESLAWVRRGYPGYIVSKEQVSGIIALTAFFIIMFTAMLIRRWKYELFYVIHVTMFVLILLNLGLHRPWFNLRPIVIVIFTGAIWLFDRVLRAAKILWNRRDNQVTVYPLANRGTRVVLRRSPRGTVPGTHCLLWIPNIRLLETHPFTIVSISADSSSLNLVIAAYDGFTSDLHEYAVKNPGASLPASIDGPYGILPDFSKGSDRIILIAGGSGASFTFGVALDMIRKLSSTGSKSPNIDFIWAVRETENISWFREELVELRNSPSVSLSLYTTRASASVPVMLTENAENSNTPSTPSQDIDDTFTTDMEKFGTVSPVNPSMIDVAPGRPDINALIRNVVVKADHGERIVIAACGPDEMINAVRRTTASCTQEGGANIELHCEKFGW